MSVTEWGDKKYIISFSTAYSSPRVSQLLITRTVFYFSWRFELSGFDCRCLERLHVSVKIEPHKTSCFILPVYLHDEKSCVLRCIAKNLTVEINLKSRLFYRKVFQPTVVPQPLFRWSPFNVKINVAICFEQGGTDLQMYVHEWLQQCRQLWKLKDIIATGKRPQVHRLVCDLYWCYY